MISPELAHQLVSGHLLVLQSKRLMLASAERRARHTEAAQIHSRVKELRSQIETAHYKYRSAMIRYGTPAEVDYWPIAYGRLIQTATALQGRLRKSIVELPLSDRYEASTDLEMLEGLVSRWSDSMRSAVAASVG